MACSKGGIQTLSLVSTILVARWLSPGDHGLMALAGIWIASIAMMTELGLGSAIIQFRDLSREELNSCFWLSIGIAMLSYVAIWVVAPFIGEWFDSPRLPLVLQVSSLSIPLGAIRTVPDSLLRKSLSLDKIAQAEILAGVVTVPLVLSMAWAGFGVWALVTGTVSAPLAQSVATFWYLRWVPGLSCSSERVMLIMRFSLSIIGSRLCWATYAQADIFVLGKVTGDVVVGLYSMGKQIAMLAVSKISAVVNQLATPMMAELQSEQLNMRNTFIKGVRMVSCVTFPICVGMIIVSEDLVRVVLTESWMPMVPVLKILCVYGLIRSVDVLFPPVLLAKYRSSFLLWYGIALLVVMPLAFYIGALTSEGFGVACAWVLVYPLLVIRLVQAVLLELGLRWTDLWRQIEVAVWPTVLMALVVIPIRSWVLSNQIVNPLARLLTVSCLGAIVYVAVLYCRGGEARQDMQMVIAWAARSRASV